MPMTRFAVEPLKGLPLTYGEKEMLTQNEPSAAVTIGNWVHWKSRPGVADDNATLADLPGTGFNDEEYALRLREMLTDWAALEMTFSESANEKESETFAKFV